MSGRFILSRLCVKFLRRARGDVWAWNVGGGGFVHGDLEEGDVLGIPSAVLAVRRATVVGSRPWSAEYPLQLAIRTHLVSSHPISRS